MRKALAIIIAIIQTLIGLLMVGMILNREQDASGNGIWTGIIFIAIILAGIGALQLLVRSGKDCFNGWLIIPEVLLAPVAILRVIVGAIIAKCNGDKIEIDYEGCTDGAQTAMCYLLYMEEGDSIDISPVRNILTQLLLCFPMACVVSGSAWYVIGCIAGWWPVSIILIYLCVELYALFVFMYIRTRSSDVTYHYNREETWFENDRGDFETRQGSWKVRDGGKSNWRVTYHGSVRHTTIENENEKGTYAISIIFGPIIAATQLIGVLIAILALFIPWIYSSYGKIDYSEVPVGWLQYVPGHLFCCAIG